MITFIYPSLFDEIVSPWDDEYKTAKEIGFNVATFDEETFQIKSNLSDNLVIYRGWMISLEDYIKLS